MTPNPAAAHTAGEAPFMKAWKEFITSPEGLRTLKAGGDLSVYAENRLWVAFAAGFNAARPILVAEIEAVLKATGARHE